MNIIELPSAESTNSYLAANSENLENYTVITTDHQTAGRGQRGNVWESEPGKNLTFSILLRPEHIKAAEQFVISQAVSVAIAKTLRKIVRTGGEVAVKWPNDIYVDDQKICGILIENSLMGSKICRSIVGVGLNVNQKKFSPMAPNPVSLIHITGVETDRRELLEKICTAIKDAVEAIADTQKREEIVAEYKSMLWRRGGLYKYAIPGGETFYAEITDIEPTGHLILKDKYGDLHRFAFKEVQYIL